MSVSRSLFELDDFARAFIRDKRHYHDVRTEELAEAFRRWFHLPAFLALHDLHQLCVDLGIPVKPLPGESDSLSGLNTWTQSEGHTIYLSSSATTAHAEHTLGHELREVIELTFARVNPAYVALDISDNKLMNQESNHFAACLLMQAQASHELLAGMGYDFYAFADATGRSLASVVLRAQELYPTKSNAGFVGGLWLFEIPWARRGIEYVGPADLKLTQRAHLRGFSLAKGNALRARLARSTFPQRGSSAADQHVTLRAFRSRRPYLTRISGFDMFDEHNFLVGAEPVLVTNVPRYILMTAVRRDYEDRVEPWLARLGAGVEKPLYQQA